MSVSRVKLKQMSAGGLSRPLRTVGEDAAKALAQHQSVLAIALLGSVARGTVSATSDIDLLVVSEGDERRSLLLDSLPVGLQDNRLSLLCFSVKRWRSEAERGSLFLHHVRAEGDVLYDPQFVLQAGLTVLASRPPDVAGEIQRQRRRLRLYRNPERLNGQHLFALAHVFAIGKATAIARCIDSGDEIFVKERALEAVARRHERLTEAANTILRLRPFYELVRRGQPVDLPFSAVGAEEELREALAAVEQLADG
jgi:Nucleotidyltransferase domain